MNGCARTAPLRLTNRVGSKIRDYSKWVTSDNGGPIVSRVDSHCESLNGVMKPGRTQRVGSNVIREPIDVDIIFVVIKPNENCYVNMMLHIDIDFHVTQTRHDTIYRADCTQET